jgi:hypothetical protein
MAKYNCYLCGLPIEDMPVDPEHGLNWDHVPPQQFYPKALRPSLTKSLWLVPTHRNCNSDYRKDEEYFYHAMYAVVADGSVEMGRTLLADLIRRIHKPQTPAMIRSILKNARTVTDGGVELPLGIRELQLDTYRLQRIAIKIGRQLIHRDLNVFLPQDACKDIHLCLTTDEMPEYYKFSVGPPEVKSVTEGVFSYTLTEADGCYYITMVFWEAFAFCCAFEGHP